MLTSGGYNRNVLLKLIILFLQLRIPPPQLLNLPTKLPPLFLAQLHHRNIINPTVFNTHATSINLGEIQIIPVLNPTPIIVVILFTQLVDLRTELLALFLAQGHY